MIAAMFARRQAAFAGAVAVLAFGLPAQFVESRALARSVPASPREFRGAWVATVDNIDWPSRPGLPVDRQKAELDAILDRAAELNLNALLFQVRPACDAFYRSDLEPWSEWLTGAQGKAPEPLWDPLQWAIDGAQARGLELHAWFNPFRASHPAMKGQLVEGNFAKGDGVAVQYGEYLWLDPGVADVREHSLKVILDVVRRYDVDGVHIDDYFYPYPARGRDFPDDESYARYVRAGGKLDRADWRRRNVDVFVEQLHRGIHELKPWVKFGISPFGIVRPGIPEGIQSGVDQYDELYADVRKWLRQGWCDYISPQLYWPIAQKEQSYPTLLRWWAAENPRGSHLWIGNFATNAATGARGWSVDELLAQIRMTREEQGATGNVHFSMKVLRDDTGGVASALLEGPYRLPALVPTSTWLDDDPPHAPRVHAKWVGAELEIRWEPDPDARWRAVHVQSHDAWYLLRVVPGSKPGLAVTRAQLEKLEAKAFAVSAVDRCGNESGRVALTL
jgi:uncharacterized lipoprotein YddW (UPF0748 family)